MPFYINNTFTRKYETNLPDEIIKIPVQVSFCIKNTGMIILVLLSTNYYVH